MIFILTVYFYFLLDYLLNIKLIKFYFFMIQFKNFFYGFDIIINYQILTFTFFILIFLFSFKYYKLIFFFFQINKNIHN